MGQLLSMRDAAAFLGINVGALRMMRVRRTAPPAVILGRKRVYYSRTTLEQFIQERTERRAA